MWKSARVPAVQIYKLLTAVAVGSLACEEPVEDSEGLVEDEDDEAIADDKAIWGLIFRNPTIEEQQMSGAAIECEYHVLKGGNFDVEAGTFTSGRNEFAALPASYSGRGCWKSETGFYARWDNFPRECTVRVELQEIEGKPTTDRWSCECRHGRGWFANACEPSVVRVR